MDDTVEPRCYIYLLLSPCNRFLPGFPYFYSILFFNSPLSSAFFDIYKLHIFLVILKLIYVMSCLAYFIISYCICDPQLQL